MVYLAHSRNLSHPPTMTVLYLSSPWKWPPSSRRLFSSPPSIGSVLVLCKAFSGINQRISSIYSAHCSSWEVCNWTRKFGPWSVTWAQWQHGVWGTNLHVSSKFPPSSMWKDWVRFMISMVVAAPPLQNRHPHGGSHPMMSDTSSTGGMALKCHNMLFAI